MKTSSTTSHKYDSASRCIHSTSHGHRCRSLAIEDSRYCFAHFRQQKSDADALISELSQAAGSLHSPDDVSRVLGKIFMALLEDRISLKKAGTLGFLGQMLLRSHREIEYYKKTHRQNEQESEAHERHLLFLKQQDERRARIEAHDAEVRRAAAEQAEQAAKAAATATKKEAREAASLPVPQASACAPSNDADAANRAEEADSPKQRESRPTVVPTAPSVPPQPPKTPPPPQPDLNHFYPIDPTLPPGRQDHSRNIPPPDAEELRWRELSRRYARSRRRH